jgi:DNA-binding NtrC family response regulator
MVLTDGQILTEKELPISIQSYGSTETDTKEHSISFESQGVVTPLEKLKENAIRHALKISDGNIAGAAKKLKIGRATLYRLAEKYKIKI